MFEATSCEVRPGTTGAGAGGAAATGVIEDLPTGKVWLWGGGCCICGGEADKGACVATRGASGAEIGPGIGVGG